MDDAPVLTHANIVNECLQSEDIAAYGLASTPPDLNPMEYVWICLARLIVTRQPLSRALPELRRAAA
ncbi:hypothetical protein TNCV_2500111 [Trichonephila clavipes]|nr:hypothetical protein TNCV_2500111 [Trichonephila clavipes]